MVSTSPDFLISIAAQLPLVAVFTWFSLRLLDRFQQDQQRRDDEWRAFLREEREARSEMASRLASEIREMGNAIERLATRHDMTERRIIEALQRIREGAET